MVSGSTVRSDLSQLTSLLDAYSSQIGDLSSFWKGASHDNLESKAEEFVSEFRSGLTSQMNAFASACDVYATYKQKKSELDVAQYNYNLAIQNKDEASITHYLNQITSVGQMMKSLESSIRSYLADASRPSLVASSLSGQTINGITFKTNSQVSASEWAIDAHSHVSSSERQRRLDFLGGFKSTEAEQRQMMTKIDVPVWDGEEETTMSLFVNKNLVDNYMAAFREVCDLRFPVNTNRSENAFCAYAWDHYRGNGARSDHALGGTFDINTRNNWGSGDGSSYSVRTREDVIEAFAKQGFYWGGDWSGSSTDDMHFTFTGY